MVTTLGAELHMLVMWRKTGEARGRIGVDPHEAGAVTMILRRTVRTADCRPHASDGDCVDALRAEVGRLRELISNKPKA